VVLGKGREHIQEKTAKSIQKKSLGDKGEKPFEVQKCSTQFTSSGNLGLKAFVKLAATRRLEKELNDLRGPESGIKKYFRDVVVDDSNFLCWHCVIVPEFLPYNKGAFKIEILFPQEYPFKPPQLVFKTKIYHPNIDENGPVTLPITSADNWKPITKTNHVVSALISLINQPESAGNPLRADLAEEFDRDRERFNRNAEEHTKKYAEKRPAD